MKSLLILAIYAVTMIVVTLIFSRMSRTTSEFMVADRKVHWFPMSLSIAATWAGAPCIFVAASLAYSGGFSAFIWFFIPNVLALMIFGWMAYKVRTMYPNGFTFAGFMHNVYDRGVQKVYLFQFLLIATMNTGLLMFTGTQVLKILSPEIPVMTYSIVIMATVLAYCIWSGIKGDVITDVFQMWTILIPLAVFFVAILYITPSAGSVIVKGMGGPSGLMGNPFNSVGAKIFFTSGIFTVLTLITNPTSDQAYWQRIFTVEKKNIHKAFIAGALEFSLIPIMMGIIGFIMVGTGFKPNNMGVGSFEFISKMLGPIATFVFIFMAMSVLLSTVDSCIVGGASLLSDLAPKKFTMRNTRWMMAVIAAGGLIIIALPNTTITNLFFLLGAVRSPSFIITLCSTFHIKFNAQGVKWGIFIPLILGTTFFVWGSITKNNNLKLVGAFCSLLLPPLIAWVTTVIVNHRSYLVIPANTVYED